MFCEKCIFGEKFSPVGVVGAGCGRARYLCGLILRLYYYCALDGSCVTSKTNFLTTVNIYSINGSVIFCLAGQFKIKCGAVCSLYKLDMPSIVGSPSMLVLK